MQRNHANRPFFFYFITSFPNPTLFFLSLRRSYARLNVLRYLSRFPSVSLFFSLRFLILLTDSLRSSALFFRGTTRPFNHVALSLARDPPVSVLFRDSSAVSAPPTFLLFASSFRIRRSLLSPSLTLSNRLASYIP